MRPLLRWAGSKRKLIPILRSYWTPGHRYVEPFAGSASLFFDIGPTTAILADINPELIHAYQKVKESPHDTYDAASRYDDNEETYYRVRAMSPDHLSPTDRAGRFIYLNRNCFNGLYRTNKEGVFNVPYGGSKTGNMPSKEEFLAASLLLQGVELRCADFRDTLDSVVEGDFVYLDPPYSSNEIGMFGKSFKKKDIQALRELIANLNEEGARFVLSYPNIRFLNGLPHDYRMNRIKVRRNIAGFSKSRRVVSECIITNIEE